MDQCSQCGSLVFYDDADSVFRGEEKLVNASDEHIEHRSGGINGASLSDSGRVPIGRFANAAEAGYFAHELTQAYQIDADVSMDEDFDALGGFWSTRYILAVPTPSAAEAGRILRQLLQNDLPCEQQEAATYGALPGSSRVHTQTKWHEEEEFPHDQSEFGSINWIPIVLTLTAGSAAFWFVHAIQDQPKPARAAGRAGMTMDDLYDQLGKTAEPWVQQINGGRGTRQLKLDGRTNRILLQEDADGDGRFERELQFQR